MTKKRPYTDTTVPHVPASEMDIMAALLRTPPPTGDPPTRKVVRKKKRGQTRKGR
jgi:hypothetical protein